MMQSQDRDAVALSARTLGALFSYAPGSEQAAPLVAALRDGSWQSQWPWPVANGLAAQFALEDDEPLADAWQRLFIGPWALPAPPWGSVWLDKESVLFGDSTLALREWMRLTASVCLSNALNRKTTSVRCCCWRPGFVNPVRMRHLTSFWPGIFSRGRAAF